MLAIPVKGSSPDILTPILVPRPTPSAAEVLISIRAAGVNRGDLRMRASGEDPEPTSSQILGLEIAGEIIEAVGEWRVGQRVCALVVSGGYAECAKVDARHVLPIPDDMGFAEAAALPEAVLTVYANVFELGALRSGQVLVVHGANSGIGVMAIQMAKAAGARVVATVRGAAKAAKVRALGADIVVDRLTERFEIAAQSLGGADVILEMLGGPAFEANLDAVRPGGRIVVIGMMASEAVSLPILKLMLTRAVISGSTLRDRPSDEKARLVGEVRRRFWPELVSGRIRPVIDSTFDFMDASSAHARLRDGTHVGKVVLTHAERETLIV